MNQLKDWTAITEQLAAPDSPSDGDELTGVSLQLDLNKQRERWHEIIDHQLIEWGQDPSQLSEESLVSPSREIINLARRVAIMCRDQNRPAPLRVVPNGEGGIVFERKAGRIFETLEIKSDRSVEHAVYQDSQLQNRERIF